VSVVAAAAAAAAPIDVAVCAHVVIDVTVAAKGGASFRYFADAIAFDVHWSIVDP